MGLEQARDRDRRSAFAMPRAALVWLAASCVLPLAGHPALASSTTPANATLTTPTSAPTTAQWTLLDAGGSPASPSARQAAAAMYCDTWDQLVLFGGFAGANFTDVVGDAWAWDFATSAWLRLEVVGPAAPPARVWHTFSALPAAGEEPCRGLLFGGVGVAGGVVVDLDDVWLAEVTASGGVNWTELAPAGDGPGPRSQHGAAEYDGDVFVFGGVHADASVPSPVTYGDLWQLAVADAGGNATWTKLSFASTTATPPARYNMGFAAVRAWAPSEDALVAFGGRAWTGPALDDWAVLSDVWVFSLSRRAWALGRGQAQTRAAAPAVGVAGNVVLFGGMMVLQSATVSATFAFSDALVTNATGAGPETSGGGVPLPLCVTPGGQEGLWCDAPDTGDGPSVRYDAAAAARGDLVLVFGGRFDGVLGDLWALNATVAAAGLALASSDPTGIDSEQSTLYFMVAVLSMMAVCFFIFVVSLRGQRASLGSLRGPLDQQSRPRPPQGARPSVIASLPIKTFRRRGAPVVVGSGSGSEATPEPTPEPTPEAGTFLGGSDDGTDMCAICLADYEDGEQVRVLPCRHAFHRACIDTWLARNNACPYCKRVVDRSAAAAAARAGAAALGTGALERGADAAEGEEQTPAPASPSSAAVVPVPPAPEVGAAPPATASSSASVAPAPAADGAALTVAVHVEEA